MATVFFALPLAAGQTESARAFIRECLGPRFQQCEVARRRIGFHGEHWYLQRTPSGELLAFHLEGPDLQTAFAAFVASRDPFDLWFKAQVHALTGIDLNAGPPPPELVAETLGEYRARGGDE